LTNHGPTSRVRTMKRRCRATRSAATCLIWSTTSARPGWVEVAGGLLSLAAVHGIMVW